MTNQEAIEVLESIKERVYGEVMALRMAEKALENQKSIIAELEKIREEIEKDQEEMANEKDYGKYYGMGWAIRIIDKHISEMKGESNND